MATQTAEPELDLGIAPDDLSDFDLFMLMDSLNTPHCESNHADERNKVCSHQVVARYISCSQRYIKICQESVNYTLWCQKHKYVCEGCKKPCTECWQVLPLNLSADS